MKTSMFNRRDFLFSLGAGSSLAIAGFFTFDAFTTDTNEPSEAPSEKPYLSGRVKKTFENEVMVLYGEKSKCLVNKTGERIIDLLDGKKTLMQIAEQISDFYAIEHSGILEAAIAKFICQMGTMGFLSSTFYVTIYES